MYISIFENGMYVTDRSQFPLSFQIVNTRGILHIPTCKIVLSIVTLRHFKIFIFKKCLLGTYR